MQFFCDTKKLFAVIESLVFLYLTMLCLCILLAIVLRHIIVKLY